MTWPSTLFALHCVVVLGAAMAGLFSRGGTRTSIFWFLLSMGSLVGVFILLGAHVIAIAQLFFCAGIGLVCLFVVGDVVGDVVENVVEDFDGGSSSDSMNDPECLDRRSTDNAPRSWHWLMVTLGVAGASLMSIALFRFIPGKLLGTPHEAWPASSTSFEAVGYTVLVDQGVALLMVGLLLFGALIGAGYLVRRGFD